MTGGRLLSPSSACIEIATSKQRTAELLCRCGIPVPRGSLLARGTNQLPAGFSLPAIMKPVDGCGSQGIRLVRDMSELGHEMTSGEFRLEEFMPGQAASIAILCGPGGNYALPACEQRLTSDGRFHYLGGSLPLSPDLNERARRVGLAAASALPMPRGYMGVDLVLGEAADGSGDRVIEINPRLTTSFIGLRAASRANLAAAMLAAVEGRPPDLCFSGVKVEFTADGAIF
jgi:predicted ATP-grasp superfamily ATP-dependent carboligase